MSNSLLKKFRIFTSTLSNTGSVSIAWGAITGTLSSQTDLQAVLDAKVDENASIIGATKTKITYDSKGLVTSGADATTADIAPSIDRNYVTDTQAIIIGNTSNTNSGDETQSSIISKLALHSDSINIDFGVSGDFLTTTVTAPWITSAHYGKIKCEVLDDGTDHLVGEAALGCVLASVNNIVNGVSFDILVVSQHDTWGRYIIKYNEII
jgi:hypothetical protein